MNNWKHCLTGLVMASMTLTVHAAPQELDRIVTIVNDGVILQSDIDTMLDNVVRTAASNGQSLPTHDVLKEQIMEQQILETLQLQEAARYGIRIDDTMLDQAVRDIAAENNQSVAELRQSVEAEGTSYTNFREQVRREITAAEARNALVRRRINILPQEVESLAERISEETLSNVQYNFSDIQLRFPDGATKEQRDDVLTQAEQLVSRLNSGADFAELAITYSKGARALQGGSWGWQRKEEMPTVFADQIDGQGKGSIIGPFRSGVGYHILKIDDVEGLETVSVVEVNARHVLVKTSVILSNDGAERQLANARQAIINGDKDFATVAAEMSADPGSAANNGELGWQTPDLYVPEFKDMVENLPVGLISEPFQTVHGWHIVEVIERRNVDRTDAAFKNRAYRILFNRKFNEEAQAWMQEIMAGAYIEHLEANDDV